MAKIKIKMLEVDRPLHKKEKENILKYLKPLDPKEKDGFQMIIFQKKDSFKLTYSDFNLVKIIDELFKEDYVETHSNYTKDKKQYYEIPCINYTKENLTDILEKEFELKKYKLSEEELSE